MMRKKMVIRNARKHRKLRPHYQYHNLRFCGPDRIPVASPKFLNWPIRRTRFFLHKSPVIIRDMSHEYLISISPRDYLMIHRKIPLPARKHRLLLEAGNLRF